MVSPLSPVHSDASELIHAAQIIDAQKARLKRELKAFAGSMQDASEARAGAHVRQVRDADSADASAEQPAVAARHEQHKERLRLQFDDLACQPKKAAGHARPSEGQENKVCVCGLSISALSADSASPLQKVWLT